MLLQQKAGGNVIGMGAGTPGTAWYQYSNKLWFIGTFVHFIKN